MFGLLKNLNPVWALTYYSGILFDWFHPEPDNKPLIVKIIHKTIVGLVGCILLTLIIFEFTQLVIAIINIINIHSVTANVLWFVVYPLPCLTFFRFLWRRREIASLFDDWNVYEQEWDINRNYKNEKIAKRIRNLTFSTYLLIHSFVLFGLVNLMSSKPEASYLFMHYQVLTNIFTIPFLMVLHIISFLLSWTFTILAEYVPGLTFYHAGLNLQSLEIELIQIFARKVPAASRETLSAAAITSISNSFIEQMQKLWRRYEKLSQLVVRANHLFGLLMVLILCITGLISSFSFFICWI